MEPIIDVLCSCVTLMKDVQSSPQRESLMDALKILEAAMNEILVGLLHNEVGVSDRLQGVEDAVEQHSLRVKELNTTTFEHLTPHGSDRVKIAVDTGNEQPT